MDVFGVALATGGAFLRDAAIAAACELGVFEALIISRTIPRTIGELAAAIDVARGTHRLRALVDVLVAIGALVREGDRVRAVAIPPRPAVPRAGWGVLADVIRTNTPLASEGGDAALRYHEHLGRAGAAAARELAPIVDDGSLLDIGGGAGTYTAAVLDAHPGATATLVDDAAVIALARHALARFGDRVTYVDGDARTVALGDGHAAVLLANVLHLHPPAVCAELCAVAAAAVAPGGQVIVKDLRVEPDRGGPLEGLMFALNMAVYTDGGDVHDTAQLRGWLAAAGLVDIVEHRQDAAPDGIVVIGRRPRVGRGARAIFEAATGLTAAAHDEATRLEAALDGELAFPGSLRTMLAHAIARERADGAEARVAALAAHYTIAMPAQRAAQQADRTSLLHVTLEWSRLPRLTAALDRLFALLEACDVSPERALGAASAAGFRAASPTFAALHARTHYGRLMPLLYGYPADLAHFARRGAALGLDALATIDRYLPAPMLHELCHFAPARDALLPLHLDECIAGWLGVHVWPEFAYPEADHDDAIYAAPWLAQVGQAIARRFGVRAVVRAHAGEVPWDVALPPAFVEAATRAGWQDWCARRSVHCLADPFDPDPWLALALGDGAPHEPAFDRAIVGDALRAMCLANACVDGSLRARTALPDQPITIDATAARVATPRRGELDATAPRYWLPPAVAARLVTAGFATCELRLATIADIPQVAAALCDPEAHALARAGITRT